MSVEQFHGLQLASILAVTRAGARQHLLLIQDDDTESFCNYCHNIPDDLDV